MNSPIMNALTIGCLIDQFNFYFSEQNWVKDDYLQSKHNVMFISE
jgi:hypothetical protein